MGEVGNCRNFVLLFHFIFISDSRHADAVPLIGTHSLNANQRGLRQDSALGVSSTYHLPREEIRKSKKIGAKIGIVSLDGSVFIR